MRQQVGELGPHVAADARDRRAPGKVVVRKSLDDVLAKTRFVVEYIVRDAQPICDCARIPDIVARTASTLAAGRGTIVIKLQGHADHFGSARGR